MFHSPSQSILYGLAIVGLTGTSTAQNILALTDASPAALNGAAHVSDLLAAFENQPGVLMTRNTVDLTSPGAMSLGLVTGWNIVLVVTVTGAPISPADIAVLQTAVNTRASDAFLFFDDGCGSCTTTSLGQVLTLVNAIGGWSATLGFADDFGYPASLSAGPLATVFGALPSLTSAAYRPLVGVPANNVLYTGDGISSDGPMAGFVSGLGTSCVFFSSDTTQFWTSGGIPQAQADGLAAAYIQAVETGCPLLATASPRDCTPPNVDVLTADAAVIGQAWSAEVTHVSTAAAAQLMIRASAIPGFRIQYGCLLVAGPSLGNLVGLPDTLPPIQANQKNWAFSIPYDLALVGLAWHAQALTLGGSARLSNAIDGVVGTY